MSEGSSSSSTGIPPATATSPMTMTTMTPGTTTDGPTSTTDATVGLDSTTTGTPMTDSSSGSDSGSDSSSGSGSESSGTTGDTVNTECADEDLGNTVPQMVMGDNTAGGDDLMPSCSGGGGGEDSIYAFTAPDDGWYQIDTTGSMLDTTVAVFDDCMMGAELACNDDNQMTTDSLVYVELVADQTVLIAVDSNAGGVGTFNLNIEQIAFMDPPDSFCAPMGMRAMACAMGGAGATPLGGTLPCDDPGGVFMFDIFEVTVAAGDCLWASVDNIDPVAGPTTTEAGDMWLIMVDSMENVIDYDDEIPCTDPAYGGYACPEGGIIASAAGPVLVGVGQYGGLGCPNPTPYTLNLAINGVDVDLTGQLPAHSNGICM